MHVILFTDNLEHPKIKKFEAFLEIWSRLGEDDSYKVSEGANDDFNIKAPADQEEAIKPFISKMIELTGFSPRKLSWKEWDRQDHQDKHPYHFIIVEQDLGGLIYINFPTELLTTKSDSYEGYTKTSDGFWTNPSNWEKGKRFF